MTRIYQSTGGVPTGEGGFPGGSFPGAPPS